MSKHKWSEVIKAWADGQVIQSRQIGNTYWNDNDDKLPAFNSDRLEWRIKPEDIILDRYIWFSQELNSLIMSVSSAPNVRFTLSSDTKKLSKVELI